MFKKLAALALALAVAVSTSVVSFAAETTSEGTAVPYYQFTDNQTADVAIYSGNVYGTATLEGDLSVTKITGKIEIQKMSGSSWKTVKSNSSTKSGRTFSLSSSYSASSGTYRVKATFTVYSGSRSEKVTVYSGEEQN